MTKILYVVYSGLIVFAFLLPTNIVFDNALIVFCLFAMYFVNRIDRVFELQKKILTDVSLAATEDILKDKPWKWRYKIFESVTTTKMIFQFWKSPTIQNFYGDDAFTKLEGERPKDVIAS